MKPVKCLFFLLMSSFVVNGQAKKISGLIVDAVGGEPIPMVSISILGAQPRGVGGGPDGTFTIRFDSLSQKLRFSAMGYRTYTVSIDSLSVLRGRVFMQPVTSGLSEVTITAKRRSARYRNKNNPAVEFIRQAISHLDSNNARNTAGYSFNEYEKLCMSLSIDDGKVGSSRLLKKFPYLKTNIDSISYPGRSLVPVFIREKATRYNYKEQELKDSVLLGVNEARIDLYLDEDGFDAFMDKLYGHPDLYSHDIALGNRRFLSPLSPMAPTFYRYYITDTIKTTHPWQLKMSVFPRNREETLFSGFLYFTLDGTYAIQHAELYVNDHANINWVEALNLELSYRKDSAGKYFLAKSKMAVGLGIFEQGMGVFGEKTFIIPSLSAGPDTLERPEPLGKNELAAFANVDSLKRSRSFRRTMAFGASLLSGYVDGGLFELGPFFTFYSFNPVEGSRIRLGGRTTNSFSKRIFFDAYGAYGTKDKVFKYALTSTVSLTPRSIYEFPVRSLSVSNSYDIQVPGQEFRYVSDDNILLSFRRGLNDRMWYNRKWQMEYFHETRTHFSFKVGLNYQQLTPTGVLTFKNNQGRDRHLNTTELFTELRWAPHENFFQGKRYRKPINNGHPIYTLRFAQGIRTGKGRGYNYQRLVSSVSKRFFLSQFGNTDVMVEGGIIFGKVPYPLLLIPRANQTYSYELFSYNLMSYMEFGSDRYAALHVQHSFNGFFLNKIPLFKKLELREIFSMKILEGNLRKGIKSYTGKGFYDFPVDEKGNLLINALGKKPYIEASVGVSNIFKVLRVEWVHRLTHLERKGIDNNGIRARLQVDF